LRNDYYDRPCVTSTITVLLVDDHALVRRGFRRLLEDDPALAVVGEAGDGNEAVRLAAHLKPTVIVMDWAMPGTGGLIATRRILDRRPEVAILMLSMHDEATLARRAFEAGARGYMLKNALDLDLAGAVKQVARGETVLDPKLAHAMTLTGTRVQELSPRQREVLQLICDGLSNPAIAATLGISVNTVAVHRASIMKMFGIHRAAELAAYAIRHRLVNTP
jgi:DNA-binding NarL/FixJ family response regulator